MLNTKGWPAVSTDKKKKDFFEESLRKLLKKMLAEPDKYKVKPDYVPGVRFNLDIVTVKDDKQILGVHRVLDTNGGIKNEQFFVNNSPVVISDTMMRSVFRTLRAKVPQAELTAFSKLPQDQQMALAYWDRVIKR